MREVVKEGRNVEEAITLACNELGVERDMIDFEIITLPKKSLFGFKVTPAKVRVSVADEPEPKKAEIPEVKQEIKKAPDTGAFAERKPKPDNEKAPAKIQETVKAPAASENKKPAEKLNDASNVPESKVIAPKEAVKPDEAAKREEKKAEMPRQPLKFEPIGELEGKEKAAVSYLDGILHAMGIDAQLLIAHTENGIVVRLTGDGLGVIIGRRGETLDALQYLCGLSANREEGDYLRVTIDSGNYREKREHTLQQLAQKLSNMSIRYGRSTTLEPMNPYERRIIHASVSKIEGVTSASIGEEPNRRVVITPTVQKPAQQGSRGSYGRSGNGRPSGGNNNSRQGGPRQGGRPGGARRGAPRGGAKPQSAVSGKVEYPFKSAGDTAPVKPQRTTSVDIDKQYAKELEKDFVKPPVKKENIDTNPSKVTRETVRNEGDNLPLYGKIEL